MATWDYWSGTQRLHTHGTAGPYRCAVCGLTSYRWREAVEHTCADQRKWRRFRRAFWRSVRNNRRRRQHWYQRRVARREREERGG